METHPSGCRATRTLPVTRTDNRRREPRASACEAEPEKPSTEHWQARAERQGRRRAELELRALHTQSVYRICPGHATAPRSAVLVPPAQTGPPGSRSWRLAGREGVGYRESNAEARLARCATSHEVSRAEGRGLTCFMSRAISSWYERLPSSTLTLLRSVKIILCFRRSSSSRLACS